MPLLVMTTAALRPFWATFWATCDTARFGRVAPGGSAAGSEEGIQHANSETMRVLAEILEVADDAQVEGRTAVVNHNAIVEAAGSLRRIAKGKKWGGCHKKNVQKSTQAANSIDPPLPPANPIRGGIAPARPPSTVLSVVVRFNHTVYTTA